MKTKQLIGLILEYLWNEYEKSNEYKLCIKFEKWCSYKGIDSDKLVEMEMGTLKVDKKFVECCRIKMI